MKNSETSAAVQPAWHAEKIEKVFSVLKSNQEGLAHEDAAVRLEKYGYNKLTPLKKKSAVVRFLLQFHNVLIYVLLATGAITLLLQHYLDAAVILGVVVLNSFIGFIQEGKAEKALDAIRNFLSQQATVIRCEKKDIIPADELVPGDVVMVQSGDKVPADLRLFKTRELRIDEAALTGESMPVEKKTEPVDEKVTLGDRTCLAYSGTLVTYGQGYGVVIGTGDNTEIGRINQMLSKVPMLTTKLLTELGEFGEKLTLAIGVMATATILFGIFVRQYTFTDMFLAGVGLAVAAIPEGLPAIVTITLAVGVQRMAKRHAIIRRLPAVETLGSVTVICSDKTGTLTRNEMTAQTIGTAKGIMEITGGGYAPEGMFLFKGSNVSIKDDNLFNKIAETSLLCNDANLVNENSKWLIEGDPTEGALTVLAIKAGKNVDETNQHFPRIDAIPFESEHRFMGTLHRDKEQNSSFICLKGAPEKIIEMCSLQVEEGGDAPLNNSYWQELIIEFAERGQRVLALARKNVEFSKNELHMVDMDGGFSLLGLVGIIDPPREEAIEAIRYCRQAGIRVKMITGDHAITAKAIGAQMGIGDGTAYLNGEELATMDDDQLRLAVQRVDVFARVSPEHKLKLVQALQANGEIVAMTGDGVNDAPALKRADVGVAMGLKGTEVAKESAEMVLTDDNFSSIAHAVEEGRTVYNNIKKAITFILPTNGGEAGIIIAAIMSGRMLPITPAQILWVNMVTAITLALALSFEPPEKGIMKRPPRDPKDPIITTLLVWRVLFVSSIIVVGTFGLFLWERTHGASIELARTIAVNTLVMFEVFYLFSTRSLKDPVSSFRDLLGNKYVYYAILAVIGAQLLFTYTAPMQQLFGNEAISAATWLKIFVISLSVFVLVELEKRIILRWELKRKKIPERPTVQFLG
ncbi:MAG: cation-transporting P-type ATPase [Desulfobulbaceae bacterium]|jgi:magnesium-transporting ATPase (P-type)|nr:cation-transporting P-type ATPase [Desulfobulbaceae bacterium]